MKTEIAIRLIFTLGLVNLITGGLILLTCRCLPGSAITRITGNLMGYRWYQRFYRYHCYIWWIFWLSVMVHAVFAIIFIGPPS